MTVLHMLGWRYAAATALGALAAALVIGIPTDVIPNPWFTRMTPVRPLDVVLLPITSVLVGALLGTMALRTRCGVAPATKSGFACGALGWLAIGCPICNKLIVAIIGVSGALTWFAPLQPLLGGAAVVMSAIALWWRMREMRRASDMRAAPPGAEAA